MKLLEDFHNAILTNNGSHIFNALKAHPRLTPAQQFSIYADGYRIRLLSAIRSDYPSLLEYMGQEIFDNFALQYIEKNPPQSYNLDIYPHKFADFLCNNHHDIFANDLALLECAIAEVFMLPDSQAILPEEIAKKSPEEFGKMIFSLRKASRFLKLATNANDYLSAQRKISSSLRGGVADVAIHNHDKEDWIASPKLARNDNTESKYMLVYRNNNEVQRLEISSAGLCLLQQLADGKTVENALEETILNNPEFSEEIASNLQNWFAEWFLNGVFKQN